MNYRRTTSAVPIQRHLAEDNPEDDCIRAAAVGMPLSEGLDVIEHRVDALPPADPRRPHMLSMLATQWSAECNVTRRTLDNVIIGRQVLAQSAVAVGLAGPITVELIRAAGYLGCSGYGPEETARVQRYLAGWLLDAGAPDLESLDQGQRRCLFLHIACEAALTDIELEFGAECRLACGQDTHRACVSCCHATARRLKTMLGGQNHV